MSNKMKNRLVNLARKLLIVSLCLIINLGSFPLSTEAGLEHFPEAFDDEFLRPDIIPNQNRHKAVLDEAANLRNQILNSLDDTFEAQEFLRDNNRRIQDAKQFMDATSSLSNSQVSNQIRTYQGQIRSLVNQNLSSNSPVSTPQVQQYIDDLLSATDDAVRMIDDLPTSHDVSTMRNIANKIKNARTSIRSMVTSIGSLNDLAKLRHVAKLTIPGIVIGFVLDYAVVSAAETYFSYSEVQSQFLQDAATDLDQQNSRMNLINKTTLVDLQGVDNQVLHYDEYDDRGFYFNVPNLNEGVFRFGVEDISGNLGEATINVFEERMIEEQFNTADGATINCYKKRIERASPNFFFRGNGEFTFQNDLTYVDYINDPLGADCSFARYTERAAFKAYYVVLDFENSNASGDYRVYLNNDVVEIPGAIDYLANPRHGYQDEPIMKNKTPDSLLSYAEAVIMIVRAIQATIDDTIPISASPPGLASGQEFSDIFGSEYLSAYSKAYSYGLLSGMSTRIVTHPLSYISREEALHLMVKAFESTYIDIGADGDDLPFADASAVDDKYIGSVKSAYFLLGILDTMREEQDLTFDPQDVMVREDFADWLLRTIKAIDIGFHNYRFRFEPPIPIHLLSSTCDETIEIVSNTGLIPGSGTQLASLASPFLLASTAAPSPSACQGIFVSSNFSSTSSGSSDNNNGGQAPPPDLDLKPSKPTSLQVHNQAVSQAQSYLNDLGIMTDISTNFLNRIQAVVMIIRMLEHVLEIQLPESTGPLADDMNCYRDDPICRDNTQLSPPQSCCNNNENEFQKAWRKGVASSIITFNPTVNPDFNPDREITRQELLTMLDRALNQKLTNSTNSELLSDICNDPQDIDSAGIDFQEAILDVLQFGVPVKFIADCEANIRPTEHVGRDIFSLWLKKTMQVLERDKELSLGFNGSGLNPVAKDPRLINAHALSLNDYPQANPTNLLVQPKTILLRVDAGDLGSISNGQARQAILDVINEFNSLPASNFRFQLDPGTNPAGSLSRDVEMDFDPKDLPTQAAYDNAFPEIPYLAVNPQHINIIFDHNNFIFPFLNASNNFIAFASPSYNTSLISQGKKEYILIVVDGKEFQVNGDVLKFKSVIRHEMMHLVDPDRLHSLTNADLSTQWDFNIDQFVNPNSPSSPDQPADPEKYRPVFDPIQREAFTNEFKQEDKSFIAAAYPSSNYGDYYGVLKTTIEVPRIVAGYDTSHYFVTAYRVKDTYGLSYDNDHFVNTVSSNIYSLDSQKPYNFPEVYSLPPGYYKLRFVALGNGYSQDSFFDDNHILSEGYFAGFDFPANVAKWTVGFNEVPDEGLLRVKEGEITDLVGSDTLVCGNSLPSSGNPALGRVLRTSCPVSGTGPAVPEEPEAEPTPEAPPQRPLVATINPLAVQALTPTTIEIYRNSIDGRYRLINYTVEGCPNPSPRAASQDSVVAFECNFAAAGQYQIIVSDRSQPVEDRLPEYTATIFVSGLAADTNGSDFDDTTYAPLNTDMPGTINTSGDRDYFHTYADEGAGPYKFEVTGMPATIKVYRDDVAEGTGYRKLGDERYNNFIIRDLVPGKKYIMIVRGQTNDTGGSYVARITKIDQADILSSLFASAALIDFRTNTLNPYSIDAVGYSSFVNYAGDSRMHKFTPNYNGEYEIAVSSGGAEYQVNLYNQNQQLLASDVATAEDDGDVLILRNLTKNQEYYLNVTKLTQGDSNFYISINEREQIAPCPQYDDHSNELATATPLNYTRSQDTFSYGNINCRGDEDLFKLVVPNTRGHLGGRFAIYTEDVPFLYGPPYNMAGSHDTRRHQANISLELLDHNGDLISSSSNRYDRYGHRQIGGNASLGTQLPLSPGTYYVRVKYNSWKIGGMAYRLMARSLDLLPGDDHGEYGLNPTVISINQIAQDIAGIIQDNIDWDAFLFTPIQSGPYIFSVQSNEIDMMGQLGDQMFSPNGGNPTPYNMRSFSRQIMMKAGETYFMRVSGVNGQLGNYTVRVDRGPANLFDVISDNIDAPYEITPGQNLSTSIEVDGDLDYYLYTAQEDGYHSIAVIDTSALPSEFETQYTIFVRDSSGIPRQRSVTNGAGAHPLYQNGRIYLNAGEQMIIQAAHPSHPVGTGRYSFKVFHDDHEDLEANASQISLGDTIDASFHSGDLDLFTFTVPADGRYQIESSHGTQTMELSPQHYVAKEILYYPPGAGQQPRFLEAELKAGITYYLKLGSSLNMPYQFTLRVNPDDHGNSIDTATDILAGQDLIIGMRELGDTGYDKDVFRIEVGTSGFYDFLQAETDLDTEVIVFDAESTALLPANIIRRFDFGDTERQMYLEAGQIYYVQVKADRTDRNYTLLNTWSGFAGDQPNQPGDAQQINIGEEVSAAIDFKGDFDWYRFDTAQGFNNDHTFILDGENLIMEVYQEDNMALRETLTTVGDDDHHVETVEGINQGPHLIKVIHNSVEGKGPYTIRVLAPDDHPNDFGINGMQTLDNDQINVLEKTDDVDLIRFYVSAGWYVLESHGDLDLYGTIYWDSYNYFGQLNRGPILHDSDSGDNGNFKFTHYFDAGTYYIRAYSPSGDIGNYNITLEEVQVSDIDDHGNDAASATELEPFTTMTGSTQYPGDEDYFGFDVVSYDRFAVEASHQFYIKDIHNNVRYVSYNYGGRYKVLYARLAPGRYFVSFGNNYSSTEFDYDLMFIPPDSEPDSVYYPDYMFYGGDMPINDPKNYYFEERSDTDAFKIKVTEDNYYTIRTLDTIQPSGSTDPSKFVAKFYNNSKQELDAFNNNASGDHLSMTKYLFAGQQYYLEMIDTTTNQIPAAYKLELASGAAPVYTADQTISLDTTETMSLDGSGAIKVIKFTSASEGRYKILVSSNNTEKLTLHLLDASKNSIYKDSTFRTNSTLNYNLAANTTYHLYVIAENKDATGSYTVEVIEPIPDDYGDDYTDAVQMDPVPGTRNHTKSGTVSHHYPDFDNFWFEGDAGTYQIKLVSTQPLSGLYIYEGPGQVYKGYAAYQNINGEHTLTANVDIESGKRYYLRSFGYTDCSYTVTATYTAPPPPQDDHSNVFSNATGISIGQSINNIKLSQNPNDSADMFSMYNYWAGYRTITITGATSHGVPKPIRMEFYYPGGQQVFTTIYSSYYRGLSNISIPFYLPYNGTYFIKLSTYDGQPTNATLRIN